MKALVIRAYQNAEIRPLSPLSAEVILRSLLIDAGCQVTTTGTLRTPAGNEITIDVEEVPVGDPVG